MQGNRCLKQSYPLSIIYSLTLQGCFLPIRKILVCYGTYMAIASRNLKVT